MKKLLFSSISFLTVSFSWAQYDVDINKKEGNPAEEQRAKFQKQREQLGNCNFTPYYDYKEGMTFYFPKDEFKLKYDDYGTFKYYAVIEGKRGKTQKAKIGYKNIVGKQFTIIKIEERKDSYFDESYITLKQTDSNFIIEHKMDIRRDQLAKFWKEETYGGQTFVLPDAIYTKEIDDFKTKFLNTELYTKTLVAGKKFQKVKIVQIGAGTEKEPIRVIVQNASGEKGQIDICTCGTNIPTTYLWSNYFDNFFQFDNPKDKFKGSEEVWDLICSSKIKIGMLEDELYLSWGKPVKINETVTDGIAHKQLIYDRQYVYIENGKISSYQGSK
jgi:hypothetical protein